jgi:hypothetical protein
VVDIPPPPVELPTFDVARLEPTADIADGYLTIAGAASGEEGDENPDAAFFVAIIDAEGDFVWYHLLPYGRGTSALDVSVDGSSIWWLELDNFRQTLTASIVRMTLDGTVLSETSAYGGHHAAAELGDGRFAYLGRIFSPGDGNETLMTDTVEIAVEGDMTGAQTVQLFDTVADWRPIDSFQGMGGMGDDIFGYQNVIDLTHTNSLAFVESEGAVYPFVRLEDTLLKIDVDGGGLVWQLSGPQSDFTFPDGEPVYEGENNSYLWSHGHYSHIWEGGLMMFDNGNNHQPAISSIVEIAYDQVNGTAEEVFRFEDPEGGFTNSLGDAWKLASGNYVASWMTLKKLTEVTPEGEVVWRLNPDRNHTIRRIRPISDLYSLASLAVPPSGE